MNWTELIPAAFKDVIFLIGLACILVGLLARQAGGNMRGLGLATVLVGLCLVIVPPLGRFMGWW